MFVMSHVILKIIHITYLTSKLLIKLLRFSFQPHEVRERIMNVQNELQFCKTKVSD